MGGNDKAEAQRRTKTKIAPKRGTSGLRQGKWWARQGSNL
jgi:hypothetical protein